MNKRMVTMAAGGALAGAAVVGLPTLAMADQDTPTAEPTSTATPGAHEMGSKMSDPELMDQMKSFMSEIMADEDMRAQMRSMMSDVMGDMGMGSGEMGMGSGETGMGDMDMDMGLCDSRSEPDGDQTP